ncbi:MAG: acyl-CoA/acyl-ACP dehydrogenase [Gammaproteobacteria bacterium]|nr:acyl-CoA/acyl-ACP dehydrogenase [Gammaproteobacteria bacterium]
MEPSPIAKLGLPAAEKIAVARCVSNEAFTRSCFTAHQVFGGMGFMWETDLHLWTRKAKQIELAFGGLERARARLAAAL